MGFKGPFLNIEILNITHLEFLFIWWSGFDLSDVQGLWWLSLGLF